MATVQRKHLRPRKAPHSRTGILVLAALACVLVFLVCKNASVRGTGDPNDSAAAASSSAVSGDASPGFDSSDGEFNPTAGENTKPSFYVKDTAINVDGQNVSSYSASDPIDFAEGDRYTNVKGIVTFRGNNFRDSGAYGTANIVNKKFAEDNWTVSTSSLKAPDGNVWTGSGWVGQPLIMTWPKDVRAHMNLYSWAKDADELTEVIYATMDGHVYFIDLASGKKTRDDLNLGYTFKGAGALDPRGYPLLYLGSGYDSVKGTSRVFIVNLLDGSILYEFGALDPFSLRGKLSFFDGSALVDAETDQLIYPGENGILYILKLNTKYDKAAGKLTIAPSNIVKWRYNGARTTLQSYWLGMEDSAVIWRGHIIMADNGGNLMCLDLNTLELGWVQNVLDDTNCSPVLELENGHPYIYISTSFHGGWRAPADSIAKIPIWKIDAENGEIVWEHDYECYTEDGVSGGVQGTLALGKNKLRDLIFVPVAKTPGTSTGILAALDKKTGKAVWEVQTQVYSWSSPVAVYDKDGNGYLVFCTSGGYMYLIDGLTGKILDSLDAKGHIEASPAVYNDTVVVGTRAQLIWGVKLT
ncbi:MAG: PQQ-binding-like beta-propeller repeat protein [Oscillospiraceae bacterium]|jgi:hypothetical protein